MRNKTIGYALAVALSGCLVVLSSREAVSQNGPGAFVNLQASSPGATQTGSLHISSVAMAGLFKGSGAGLTNLAAPSITSGLLNDARLSPRVPLTNRLNTFSAVQRFASNILMTSSLNTITFPAVAGNPNPMINMFLSGENNADRMVISHSPNWTNYGLQYRDGNDDFVFLGNGNPVLWVGLGSENVGIRTSGPQIDLAIGDDNTGFDYPGNGVLDGYSNGTLSMSLSGGNAGFGTNDPQRKVHAVHPDAGASAIWGLNDGINPSVIHDQGFYHAGIEGAGQNGVIGAADADPFDGYGVVGIAKGTQGRGVYGLAVESNGTNYGVYGTTNSFTNGYGVFSSGVLGASGTKSFRIDHPSDPTGKYLLHYSSEGPEPLNIYTGTIQTGQDGFATVTLPPYYEDINRDARIQLTVQDGSDDFVMVKVVRAVAKGQFTLRTNKAFTTVYWEVKAVRNDRFVQQYGAPVEKNKPVGEAGRYQQPELYGYGPERGYVQGGKIEKINP